MMVVPVLMTSCHVSLNPKSGPVAIQTTMTATARAKVRGRPQKCEAAFAKPEYQAVDVAMAGALSEAQGSR